jgi:hypothetical protein
LEINEIKTLIINELKKKQNDFNLENQKNKDVIDKLKKENKDKYKKAMEQYKLKLKENKKSVIKEVLIRPRMEKLKIDKVKRPVKPRGIVIKKIAPDEVLKAEIKEFCKNLANARHQAFVNNKYDKTSKKLNEDAYEIKYKNISNTQTISIDERGLNKDGIYIRALGKINCNNWEKITKKYSLNKGCKLQYDYVLNKYYIFVVFETEEKIIKGRKEVVALDPRER